MNDKIIITFDNDHTNWALIFANKQSYGRMNENQCSESDGDKRMGYTRVNNGPELVTQSSMDRQGLVSLGVNIME